MTNQMENGGDSGCFLRWAGGKRWLSTSIAKFIADLDYDAYIEPFLGGASTFFALQPPRALLSDCNAELINAYEVVRDNHVRLEKILSKLQVSREDYEGIRATIPRSSFKRAARFIYLNRTCFNGLYRTNRRGEFNVPYGGGDRNCDFLINNKIFEKASEALLSATLQCRDFEDIIKRAKRGDVVYCDPAYTVAHGSNGFVRYNETVFSWEDQRRLKIAAVHAASRGVRVLVSNAAHWSLEKLYHPYKPLLLSRSSRMAARKGRGIFDEYLFLLGATRAERNNLAQILSNACLLSD